MLREQQPYTYDRLRYTDSIRLLTLLPAPRKDMPISCILKHFSKSKSQRMRRYKALSYTWDSNPSRMKIVLNGQRGWVTSNLHTAWKDARADLLGIPYKYYSHTQKLEELVVVTRFAKATDPRDRIIALLGLIEAGHGQEIKPDYRMSAYQICSKAIQAMLADRGSDFVFNLASDQTIQTFLNGEHEHENFVKKGKSRHWEEGGLAHCDGSTCGTEAICFNTPVIWRAGRYKDSQDIIEALESRTNTSLIVTLCIQREIWGGPVRPPGLRLQDTGPIIWG